MMLFLLILSLSTCLGEEAVIAVGEAHTCFGAVGQVRCWGRGSEGQIGTGSSSDMGSSPNQVSSLGPISFAPSLGKITSLSTGYRHTCALFLQGRIVCFGLNNYGQLGIGNTSSVGCGPVCLSITNINGLGFQNPTFTVKAVSSGGWHNCALFSNGKVRWY